MFSLNLKSQPHEYSSKVIQAGYLITKYGQGAQADLSIITKNGNMNRYSIAFNTGEIDKSTTKYNVIKADYKYLYTLVSKKPVYLNLGGGGFLSCELTSNDILDRHKNKFSPGLSAILEFELFISNIGLFVSGEQLYRPASIIGKLEYRIDLGLKYVFRYEF